MSAAGRASITTRDRDDSHRARDSSRTASTRDVRRRARRGWRRARRGDAVRGVKIHIRRARQRLLDLHGLSVGGPIEGSSHERRHAGERSARPDDDRAACLVRRALDLPAAGESESRRAVAVPPATLAVRRTHGPGERSDRRHVVPRGVGTRGNLRSVARSRRRPRHRPRGAHQGDLGAASSGVGPAAGTARRSRFRDLRGGSLSGQRPRRRRRAGHPVDRRHVRGEALRRVHPRDRARPAESGGHGARPRRGLRRAVSRGGRARSRGRPDVRLRSAQRDRYLREPLYLLDTSLVALQGLRAIGSTRGPQRRVGLSGGYLAREAGVGASPPTERGLGGAARGGPRSRGAFRARRDVSLPRRGSPRAEFDLHARVDVRARRPVPARGREQCRAVEGRRCLATHEG